jgi:multicomponent Na+:H+ antiporter subunit E
MNLLWALILSVIWMALWHSFNFVYFGVGFILALGLLRIMSRLEGGRNRASYGAQIAGAIFLSGFFVKELWKSNLKVAIDMLRRQPQISPAIVAVPLDLQGDSGITILSSLITLTPGTLSLDVSSDRKTLYVHTLYFSPKDRQAFIDDIKLGFELRLKKMGFE